MNLVSTLLIRSNGLITPLFWRIWVQDKEKAANVKKTKIDLGICMYYEIVKVEISILLL